MLKKVRPRQVYAYWTRFFPATGIIGAAVSIFGGVDNHLMESVTEAMEEKKAKENKK